MDFEFSDEGKAEFMKLERQLQLFFKTHLEKLKNMPPRRHLKHGVPHHVEDVTKQARLVYEINQNRRYIIHCFATHKEYEKWFRSFK